jgi:tetratricopeptide (TPR) repeat protein
MRIGLILAAVLSAAACKKAPSTPAAVARAPIEVTDEEMKRFLDGMLVTSDVPPIRSMIWPVDDLNAYTWSQEIFSKGWGLKSRDEVKAFLARPVENMGRTDAWLLDKVGNLAQSVEIWKALLRKDPDDLEAAIRVAPLVDVFEGPEAALAAISKTSGRTAHMFDKRGGGVSPGTIEEFRCALLLLAGKPERALTACSAAAEVDEHLDAERLAEALLASGRKKEGLAQAQRIAKAPGKMRNAHALFVLGLAQHENGLDQDARTTWALMRARWPQQEELFANGRAPTVLDWERGSENGRRYYSAFLLGECGRLYSELGLTRQAEACWTLADKIEAGPATANRAVFIGMTDPKAGLTIAKAAAATNPHVELLTATAWLLYHDKQIDEAQQWTDRALAGNPWDVKAMSLKWQLCGEKDDYVCLISYRKRLGLPTHFNQEQYRNAARAFREQALKNGEGLAAREPDSTAQPKPPRVGEIVVVPLGGRVAPELEGLPAFLSDYFPGLKVSVGPAEELPAGAYHHAWRGVVWDDLEQRLREQPGRIYVLERDLGSYDEKSFLFSRLDFAHARAAVSLSRLRSPVGNRTDEDTTLTGGMLTSARNRFRSQMIATVAKLLGVSFHCQSATCALRERRSVADFDLHEPAFCETHGRELRAALASR